MTGLSCASGSDIGYRSDNNEDSYCAVPELGLWFIADGMGGHKSGEVASAIVSESVVRAVRQGVNLVDAISLSHEAIIGASEEGIGTKRMGSTIVALQVKGNDFEVAWVGDSRAYLWDGELRQISRDHSYVQKLLDSGAITEEEAVNHPNRNIITQSLGADLSDVVVENVTGQFYHGHKILLCSDGLTDEVADSEISFALQQTGEDQSKVNALIELALDNGGKDNITVLLVSAPENSRDESNETAIIEVPNSSTQKLDISFDRGSYVKLWYGLGIGVVCLVAIVLFF